MLPQFRSQPLFIASAADSGAVFVTPWCSWKSRIAPQSEMTCPSKPQHLRRMSIRSSRFPQQGDPLTLLYAPMTASTFPSCTQARNAGRYVSNRSCCDTLASKPWRQPSGPLWTAKCFAQAAAFSTFSSCPCMPCTNRTPIREVRYGSSPKVSCPRPQRGSRKMLMFGAQKVSPL